MRLINADALLEDCLIRLNRFDTSDHDFKNCYPYWIFYKAITEAPRIEAEPVRHACWAISLSGKPFCTGCGRTFRFSEGVPNYCPNCGAYMKEVYRR